MRETLLSQSLYDRQPHHAIEPTEKTAPPRGPSKYTMSDRRSGSPPSCVSKYERIEVADQLIAADAFKDERGPGVEAPGLPSIRVARATALRGKAHPHELLWRAVSQSPQAAQFSRTAVVILTGRGLPAL